MANTWGRICDRRGHLALCFYIGPMGNFDLLERVHLVRLPGHNDKVLPRFVQLIV